MSTFIELLRSGELMDARRLLHADPGLAQFREENGVSAVLVARYFGHSEFARELADHHPGIDIFEAAAIGDLHRIRTLLEDDPKWVEAVNTDGFSALGLAAYFGHLEAVEVLLSAGADPNIPSSNALDVLPIHSALAGGHQQIVERLIRAGSDVNDPAADDFTPLHYVAESGDIETARMLIRAGARDGAVRKDGMTALEVAESHGFRDLAQLLQSTIGLPA